MDQKTSQQLLELNRRFYNSVAVPFSQTRQQPWKGWEQLLHSLQGYSLSNSNISVLDLGCGNGRWGAYLAQHCNPGSISYTGIDENRPLLQEAGRILLPLMKVLTLERLSISDYLQKQSSSDADSLFDLIVLFGVWHHIPGSQLRQQLLAQLSALLQKNGILVVSCWKFLRSPKLKERLIDPNQAGIDQNLLEKGDYILDWKSGSNALRYCHDTAREEITGHARTAGLHLLQDFSADGATGDLNDYYLFGRQQLLAN